MTYRCPICKAELDDDYDLVGKRYPNGLTRKQEYYNYTDKVWVSNGSTVSNTLYYRCKCGANVHVKTLERVRAM